MDDDGGEEDFEVQLPPDEWLHEPASDCGIDRSMLGGVHTTDVDAIGKKSSNTTRQLRDRVLHSMQTEEVSVCPNIT